jgi:hypothetical protein
MSFGGAALSAAREVQIPILAMLLIGACAAKAQRAIRTRSMDAAVSPTAMFPLRLRKPMAFALCASELVIGAGLVVTAGPLGHGGRATAVRVLAALLFATAVGALHEVRSRRPATGCGCFGDLSDTPVGMRTLARSALLCLAAIASVGVPPLQAPASVDQALWLLGAGGAELALLALISPEVGEILVRLGYSAPCEARRLPVSRTMTALRASGAWRHYQPHLATAEPSDVWREGCWRFAVYPAAIDGERKDVVFAVYLQARRPPVRVTIVDAVPAPVFIPFRSDDESPGGTGSGTVRARPSRWVSASSRALARRRRPPATPARMPVRPLASTGPMCTLTARVPGIVMATSGEQVVLHRPRFVPHRNLVRSGTYGRPRSTSV